MEEMPSVSSTNNTSSVDAFSLTPLPKVSSFLLLATNNNSKN